jgi:acetyl-CoA decarbonylase/synthase complex subunit beta
LDPLRGEWSGVNEAVEKLSHGRTRRVQLHCIDDYPHTGCGCFRMIMFKTDRPRPGIGIMAAGHEGRAPDGRSWEDLHYALTGKQTPGMAGAPPSYMFSPKFLQAHQGWKGVVWVCPKTAAIMGDRLPPWVQAGQ